MDEDHQVGNPGYRGRIRVSVRVPLYTDPGTRKGSRYGQNLHHRGARVWCACLLSLLRLCFEFYAPVFCGFLFRVLCFQFPRHLEVPASWACDLCSSRVFVSVTELVSGL